MGTKGWTTASAVLALGVAFSITACARMSPEQQAIQSLTISQYPGTDLYQVGYDDAMAGRPNRRESFSHMKDWAPYEDGYAKGYQAREQAYPDDNLGYQAGYQDGVSGAYDDVSHRPQAERMPYRYGYDAGRQVYQQQLQAEFARMNQHNAEMQAQRERILKMQMDQEERRLQQMMGGGSPASALPDQRTTCTTDAWGDKHCD